MSVGEYEPLHSDSGDPRPRPSIPLTHRDALDQKFPVDPETDDDFSSEESDPIASLETRYVGRTRPETPPEKQSPRPLHRLGEVRKQQGVSRRSLARRLGVDLDTVCEQEQPTTDLPLSMLYKYQQVLEVPIAHLLVDLDDPLATSVLERARLVRIMKTAMAILEKSEGVRLKRLAEMLVDQLVEIMPELKEVSAWHTVGRRRNLEEFGRILERVLPDDMFGNE